MSQALSPDLNVLIVEDKPSDLELTRTLLSEIPNVIATDTISSLSKLKKQLEDKPYDVILLDLNLDDTIGMETVKKTVEIAQSFVDKHIAIIILTGLEDFKISKDSLKIGVKDYLIKGEFNSDDLKRSLTFATYEKLLPVRQKGLKRFKF